jgi:hypothetical protein
MGKLTSAAEPHWMVAAIGTTEVVPFPFVLVEE